MIMNKNEKLSKLEWDWILYDTGNSAFILLVSTIIPIFFKNIAASQGVSAANSTAYWSYAVSISTIIIAVMGPILGTLADTKGFKKPIFMFSMLLGVIGCASLGLAQQWYVFLIIFVIASTGFSASLIFYDSMLTDITSEDNFDKVSANGYAYGYIGSCVPFIISLILIMFANKINISTGLATSISFILNSVWWLVFTLPLLKSYKQRYYIERSKTPVSDTFKRLKNTLINIKLQKNIFTFLIAFFFYIDGVYTIIEISTAYGKDVGITDNNLLLALLLTQIVAFPFAIIWGKLAKKYNAEKLIVVCIIGYIFIAAFALQLNSAWQFWILAVCVAIFQGGIQSLSRSYFAKIIPKECSNEYFGFLDIFGKGASILGVTFIGISTQITGDSKLGLGMIILMFIFGLGLFVKSTLLTEIGITQGNILRAKVKN